MFVSIMCQKTSIEVALAVVHIINFRIAEMLCRCIFQTFQDQYCLINFKELSTSLHCVLRKVWLTPAMVSNIQLCVRILFSFKYMNVVAKSCFFPLFWQLTHHIFLMTCKSSVVPLLNFRSYHKSTIWNCHVPCPFEQNAQQCFISLSHLQKIIALPHLTLHPRPGLVALQLAWLGIYFLSFIYCITLCKMLIFLLFESLVRKTKYCIFREYGTYQLLLQDIWPIYSVSVHFTKVTSFKWAIVAHNMY